MFPRKHNMSGASETAHSRPEGMTGHDMEFPVPADGVIPVHIQLMNETETLTIDVSYYFSYTVKPSKESKQSD